jgi:two-component system NtrC family sensor kinase
MSLLWLVEDSALQPAAWSNVDEDVARTLRVEIDEPMVDHMRSERRVVVSELLAGRDLPHPPLLAEADHTLAVSLVAAGGPVGVLVVASQRPGVFGAAEERLLTILADHAAIAVENARLYQQLKDQLATLQRTQAQLLQTEKLAAMGQLLAGVAHELNNPLAVVMGRTALLAEQLAGSPLVTQAEKIALAAERSARIVRNFLALARQRPPERQPVELNHVVRESVELLAYQLGIDNVEAVLDLASGLPLLWADPNQLHQVMVNLVSNAHHALRGRRPPRRVTITTRADATRSRVTLTVADTGPGIPADVQGRIFEPFFTTKPTGQGTGLGLSLCRGIVEGHDGSIWLESAPGQGATFRLELPAASPADPHREPAGPVSSGRLPGQAILIADDEPEVADMLAEILAADGHRVDTVSNGVAALARLRDQAYDIIVTDVKMPELDGPGLYRELERRHPALLRRVIFLTGDTLSSEVTEFLETTGVCSVSKPFTLDEIRRAIQRVLSAG